MNRFRPPTGCPIRKSGGAHGFNTETSPGPAVPPVASLKRFLPSDKHWPINSTWDYHAGGGAFRDVHVFTEALNNRYGKPPASKTTP